MQRDDFLPSDNENDVDSLLVNQNGVKKSEDLLDFDEILNRTVGEFGRYPKLIVCILCIPTCFLSAFATFDLIFITYTPKFNCSPLVVDQTKLLLINADQCSYVITNGTFNETKQCTVFNYDQDYFQRSIVTDWNLVCDRALIPRNIISLMCISFLLGVIIFSYVQDWFGRKKAFLLNLIFYLIGNLASLTATSPLTFTVFKFIAGINCMWRIGFVWAMEFVGPSQRTLVNTILSVVYGFANILLALIAYLTRTWTIFGFFTSLPFLVLFFLAYLLPESPRWLIAQGRVDETETILKSMIRWERQKIDTSKLRQLLIRLKVDNDISSGGLNGFWEFFSSKNLLYKNLVLTIVIVASNQLYLAVAYDSENLHENFYIAYVLQALVEPPSTFLNLWLLNRYGRIWPLSLSLLLSGFFCLLAGPIESLTQIPSCVVVLTSISRFFVCASVAISEQLGSELYPTVGRGIGMSVSYVAQALANVAIQYIIYSSKVWKFLPLLIMGLSVVVAGVVSLLLPETKGKPLPDTVQQAEAMGAVGCRSVQGHFCFLTNDYVPLKVHKV